MQYLGITLEGALSQRPRPAQDLTDERFLSLYEEPDIDSQRIGAYATYNTGRTQSPSGFFLVHEDLPMQPSWWMQRDTLFRGLVQPMSEGALTAEPVPGAEFQWVCLTFAGTRYFMVWRELAKYLLELYDFFPPNAQLPRYAYLS